MQPNPGPISIPPRILVLFGNVPLFGQERANIETLHALQEHGCAVRFLIRPDYTEESIQPELRRRGIEFQFVPYFPRIRYRTSLRTWWRNVSNIARASFQLLRQIRHFGATHLHVGSTANVLNFMPALALCRTPLIFRAGDLPARHHFLWRLVWVYTMRRSKRIVCDSHFVRQALVRMGAPADKLEVIYAPAPRRTDASAPLQGEVPKGTTVLYVGQLTAHKGVEQLVDAAMRLVRSHDVRFVIAGDFSWQNDFAVALINRVRTEALEERIVFTGFVENIDALYAQAQLHVCPTITDEPYGLTVLEAKTRGVASIVFPSGALPELVSDGVDGRVCSAKTSPSLCSAIEFYLQNPEAVRAHGRAARDSLGRMRVDEFGVRWLAAYQR